MDGVLADIYGQLIRYELQSSGTELFRENLYGQDEIVAFPNGRTHANEKGFFRTAPVIEDAVDTLKELSQHYEIFIVSAAMEFPNSLEDKYHWLDEHFDFIPWKNIVLCGDKRVIRGDIMIDDHFKNLDYFDGTTLLFEQPHNSEKDNNGHRRVRNWKEIRDLLL